MFTDWICHFSRKHLGFARDGPRQYHLPGVGVRHVGKAGYKEWSYAWRMLCPVTEFKNLLLTNQPGFLTSLREKNNMDTCGIINI